MQAKTLSIGVLPAGAVTATTNPVTGRVRKFAGSLQVNEVVPVSRRIILIGDSFVAFGGGNSIASPIQALGANLDSKGVFNLLNVMLNQYFVSLGNAGIGGQKSRQIADRYDSDVAAYDSDWVWIWAGRNDTSADTETKTNLQEMYDKALRDGRRVIALTIPPNSDGAVTDATRKWHMSVNAWIKSYAATKPWMYVIDAAAAWVDPAGGVFRPLSGMTTDGTHPSATGAVPIALAGYAVLSPVVSMPAGLPQVYPGDDANLLSNPLLTGTGTTAPTGWSALGSPAMSYVARTDGVAGSWFQMVAANGANAGATTNVNIGTSLAVGDTVTAEIEFQCSNLDSAAAANTQGVFLKLQCWNGSSFFASSVDLYWDAGYANQRYPTGNGVMLIPRFTIPVGTTILQMHVQFNGGGTYKIHRAATRKI